MKKDLMLRVLVERERTLAGTVGLRHKHTDDSVSEYSTLH